MLSGQSIVRGIFEEKGAGTRTYWSLPRRRHPFVGQKLSVKLMLSTGKENVIMNFRTVRVLAVAGIATLGATGAFADTVEVKGVVTKWDPAVVFVKPGDSVKFTGMAGHDSAAYEGMVPEGAEVWHSKMGEEGFTVTLAKEGAYMYKCTPHESLGMVGAIVVGEKAPSNLDAILASPKNKGMVGRTIKELDSQVKAKFK